MDQETTPKARYPDAYNLGRAISIIESLLHNPDSDIPRWLAEKFLEEMLKA